MKKALPLLLILLLSLAFACAETPVPPALLWDRDAGEHWQLDDSGAAVNRGAHAMDDDRCTVCGCELQDWGDGNIMVTDRDAYGNTLRYTSYENGVATYDSVHLLTCTEDGVVLRDVEFIGGVLCGESVYTVNASGEQIPVLQTAWNEDGTTSVNEFDEFGNCVRAAIYEADGSLIHETLSEYARLEDDWFGVWYYECKQLSRFASGETFYQETNRHGDTVCSRNTYADGTVWSDNTYEYEYKNGSPVWRRQYSFGVLTGEMYFDSHESLEKEIEHLEDGSRIVCLYNAEGDPTTATTYAADGSLLTVTAWEYRYNDEGSQQEIRMYIDGVPAQDTVFLYDEEGSFIGYCETEHHADGARTARLYDDWFELVSTTVYAADGSVISTAPAAD